MLNQTIRVVITNGIGGCGKSTFCTLATEYCRKHWNKAFCKELSTVDFVKEVAKFCGWDGSKEQKDREFLHDLKMALETWDEIPNRKVIEEIKNNLDFHSEYPDHVYFVNIREPRSIETFKNMCEAEGFKVITLLITRNKFNSTENPELIAEVNAYEYDLEIQNNYSILELEEKAHNFIKNLVDGNYDKIKGEK